MKKISLAVGAVSAFFVPFLALAASGGVGIDTSGATSVINSIQSFINILIPFIIGLAVLVFIFGLFKYVTAGGDPEKLTSARNTIIWGIIIIAVMISVWGLINIVVNTFGLDQRPNVQYPCIGDSGCNS